MFTEKSEHHTKNSTGFQVEIPRQKAKTGGYTNDKFSCVHVQFYYQGPTHPLFIHTTPNLQAFVI